MSKDELRAWFARAGSEYTARKAAAKKKVVRWEYATKADRSIEPGYFERREDIAPGRALRKLPAQPKYGTVSYGLDEAGRCVLERMATLRRGCTERFLNWSDGALEWVHYQDPKNAASVGRATLDAAGRIVSYTLRGRLGGCKMALSYRADGKVVIDETYFDEHWRPGRPQRGVVTLRRGPSDKPSFDELLPPLETQLVELIPERVRALKLKERAFSIVLSFPGTGSDMFPPMIVPGLERERAAWIAKGLPLADILWDVAEYELHTASALKLRDKTLAKACSAANRELARHDAYAKGYASYARIVAALRKLDWSRLLPISEDFVLFAVDHDDSGLMRAVSEAAGAKRFAKWKKLRWVR